MKCLLCNYENSQDSQFCNNCGSQIPRCPTCGKQLTTRDRFCINDGTRLPEELLMLIYEAPANAAAEEAPAGMFGARVAGSLIEEVEVPQNVPERAFCLVCGAPVWEGESYCENCKRAAAPAPTAVCASCGMPCAPGKDYCEFCNPYKTVAVANRNYQTSLSADTGYDEPVPMRTEPRKKKKGGTWVIALLVIVLLLLIGAAAALFAGEMGWIELPEFLASDSGDNDRDSGKSDDDGKNDGDDDKHSGDDGEQEPGGDDSGNSDAPQTTTPTEPSTAEPTEEPTEAQTEAPTEKPPVTTPAEAEDAALLSFVNNCDKMYFGMEDVVGFDREQARLARNACYAHGGRKFKDKELQAYYEQFDWYTPIYEPSEFDDYYDEAMNKYLKKNLELIREYEKEMGFG